MGFESTNNKHGKVYDQVATNDFEPIISAIWVEKKSEKAEELTCLKYDTKEVYVKVTLGRSCKGKTIKIKYYEYNRILRNTLLKTINYTIPNNNLILFCPVSFTIEDYIKVDEDDKCEYIFEIELDNQKYEPKRKLDVHAVIYIPEIMQHLGWPNAFKSQDIWFKAPQNDYPWEREPIVEGFSFDWAISFPRVLTKYIEYKDMWKTPNAQNLLRDRIKAMVKDGIVFLPSKGLPIMPFGTFDRYPLIEEIRNHEEATKTGGKVIEKIPTFDKYYMQDRPYEESKFSPLDDFFGAIANCNFRFVAKGFLIYDAKNSSTNVQINQIGVYIRDGFDFVDNKKDWISQPLGFWSLKKKDVERIPVDIKPSMSPSGVGTAITPKFGYRYINNQSYKNYQIASGMGGNFYRYSDLKIIPTNFSFDL